MLTLFIHLQGTIRRATYFEPQKANKKYRGESRPWGNLFIYLVYILWCQHTPLPPGALNMLSEKYRAINSFFLPLIFFFITAIKVYSSDKPRRFISLLRVFDETEVWQSQLDVLKLSHIKL